MNEPKTMTIQDCKLTLDEVRLIIEGHKENRATPSEAMQFDYVLSLLARVEMPSEEDRAVLWLIRDQLWTIGIDMGDWFVYDTFADGTYDRKKINPIEEARKLGWGGGE